MDFADVKTILTDRHVDPELFGIDEEKPDALCILEEGDAFSVVLCEGERRVEAHDFATCNDACVYFLLRARSLFVQV